MNSKSFLSITFSAIIVIATSGFLGKDEKSIQGSKVNWLTIEDAYALNQKEPRKFFIDMYTDWCGWCKKMDATTFSDPIIADYLNKKYHPVKFNAEQRDSIKFRDKTFAFIEQGNRGYNELAVELAGERLSFPTIVFLDERANTIQAIPGYRGSEELDPILKYFGDNHFRVTDWPAFSSTYKSLYNK